jgi:hypothetical protein
VKLKVLCLLIGLCFFSISSVVATTFQVMPLEQLVSESNAAAEVELKEKKSFMTPMGMIQTTFKFIVHESYNLSDSDLESELLAITMTGGTVGNLTSFIDGAPDFSVGEKTFLLLKKQDTKIYISNFTMGKYKVLEYEGQKYYVSSVFPADRDIGRVKKERMVELIKEKFKLSTSDKTTFRTPVPVVAPVNVNSVHEKTKANREIAQIENAEPESQKGFWALMVYLMIFVISSIFLWWKLGKGANE